MQNYELPRFKIPHPRKNLHPQSQIPNAGRGLVSGGAGGALAPPEFWDFSKEN